LLPAKRSTKQSESDKRSASGRRQLSEGIKKKAPQEPPKGKAPRGWFGEGNEGAWGKRDGKRRPDRIIIKCNNY